MTIFQLRLLGGARLETAEGPVQGRAAHRRRLALLALLARAPEGRLGRERVLAYLWPEHATDAGRRLLSESLYIVRRELGEAAVVATGDELAIDRSVVRCDVDAFLQAVADGDVASALAEYRGPFLDGWYVADAPEFERWAERQREQLAGVYRTALQARAESAEAAGQWSAAAECWRTLVHEDPLSARIVERLALALDRAGERAAALQAIAGHETLLRADMGVGLDDRLTALVAALRAVRPPPVVAPAVPPVVPPVVAPVVAPTAPAADAPPFVAPPVVVPPLVAAAPPGRRRWRPLALGLLTLLGALGGVRAVDPELVPDWLRFGARTETPADAPDARRLAVLYFDDHSRDRDLGYVADGLTEELIAHLSQVPALQVVSRHGVKPFRGRPVPFDSIVQALRVGSVVEGSVQRSEDRLRVTVTLVDAASGAPLTSTTLERPLTELFALERDVVLQVAAGLRRRLGEGVRLRQSFTGTTSLDAHRLLMLAVRERDDATTLGASVQPHEVAAALGGLARAESLLVQAERHARSWTRPAIERGWVAYDRARLLRGAERAAAYRQGLRLLERPLYARAPAAEVLELRGTLRWALARAVGGIDTTEARVARADLEAAVAADSTRARAWASLSNLYWATGDLPRATRTAERALAADAYLDAAQRVFFQLFSNAVMNERLDSARVWCDRGRATLPASWNFVECDLTLMKYDEASPPDTARAWALVRRLDALDPPAQAARSGHAYAPIYRRMVAAQVMARAGAHDRARAELARARAAVADDPELHLDLGPDEANLLRLLGDTAAAEARLAAVLRARPVAELFRRDPLLRRLMR